MRGPDLDLQPATRTADTTTGVGIVTRNFGIGSFVEDIARTPTRGIAGFVTLMMTVGWMTLIAPLEIDPTRLDVEIGTVLMPPNSLLQFLRDRCSLRSRRTRPQTNSPSSP